MQAGLFFLTIVTIINVMIMFLLVNQVNRLNGLFKKNAELMIGRRAPDFHALDLQGKSVHLKDFEGQKTLFVFVAPRCQPCHKLIPELQSTAASLKAEHGVSIVLVSEGDEEQSKLMAKELNVQLPMLIAPRTDNYFTRYYNPSAVSPYYCFINERQYVLSRNTIGHKDWHELPQIWKAS